MNSDFVNAIVSLLKENQLTRKEADHLAIKHGIIDKTVKKELIELAIVRVARSIALENNSFEIRFSKIVELYKNQINLSHRTSQSIIFQQYSTPAPIGFLAGEYVRHGQNEDYQIFEPSAGNGLLTISFPERNCWVNEIDNLRNANLNTQDFIQVLKVDATSELAKELHFEKKFDGITTNPPFGTYPETIDFSGFPIKHLDHLMAIRALECMKTEGRAAIIIGGHTNYDAAGRIQSGKNRIFLSYLYKHYHVDDVINIDGSLYSKQGTSFDVRLILISGRKLIPEGFPPLFSEESNPVTDFESLFERVKALMQIKHIPLNNRLRIAQAKAKALILYYSQTNYLGNINNIPKIDRNAFSFKDEKELKKKIVEYVKNSNYIGLCFEKNIGSELLSFELTWQGLKNDINEYHPNYIEKLLSFLELPQIINNAQYIITEDDKRKRTDVKAVHKFFSKVIIGDFAFDVILIVYETSKTYLYDHILIK